ncbi:MAG TPA: hypothetical protein PK948_06360 [Gemmatimonadales bacterium]|jgi:hypothetical protein|nr:hypothetical protein [Gemmatimonadales bacterium]
MTSTWASVAVAACLAAPLSAQSTVVREAGLATVVTFAEPAVYTAGLTASLRPSLRTRVGLYAGGGVSDGEGVGRAELVAHFLLTPRSAHAGVYGGGGLAGVFGSGFADGYIVLLVGVEGAPGGRGGWFVEAGIGGGARLAAGYRWRKLPPGWRAKG